MNKILIKTAGRTGSHVIAQQKMSQLGITESQGRFYHNQDLPPQELYTLEAPVVVHDHTMTVPQNSHEWDLVVSVRRSVYDQAVSYCIAKQSENFGHAPAPDGDFIIDDDLFVRTLKNYKVVNYYWLLIAELIQWRSTEIIYWEDCLPLDRDYPMNYPAADKNRVVNHPQLMNLAERYVQNHNWAIDLAAERAAQHIGTIGRVAARALLVGD